MEFKNLTSKNLVWVIILSVSAIVMRLLPHPPNVTPMTAICLFSGMVLGFKLISFIIPFIVLYLSDFLINNTIGKAFIQDGGEIIFWSDFMTWTYLSYILIIGLSAIVLKKHNTSRVAIGAFGSGILFFVLTNFGSWLSFSFYPKTLAGLMLAYEGGIPFLRFSLLGDVAFALVLYISYNYVTQQNTQLTSVKSKV